MASDLRHHRPLSFWPEATAQHRMSKILMIEDSPPNADLYCAYLEKAGIESVLAVTGAEGLELAASQSFDLLLLDLELPGKLELAAEADVLAGHLYRLVES